MGYVCTLCMWRAHAINKGGSKHTSLTTKCSGRTLYHSIPCTSSVRVAVMTLANTSWYIYRTHKNDPFHVVVVRS